MASTITRAGQFATAITVLAGIGITYFLSNPRRKTGVLQTGLLPDQERQVDENLLTPANATFGIAWGTIYSGIAGLAIHQALPAQAENPRYAAARPWLAGSFALNAVFGYFFAHSGQRYRVGAALTTIALLPTAIGIHKALRIGEVDTADITSTERTLRKGVSLYLGWLTVASIISVGNLLREAGWDEEGDAAAAYAGGTLGLVSALGLWLSRQLRDPYILLPITAAYGGIAAKQYHAQPKLAASAGAGAVALASAFVAEEAMG